MDAMHTDYPLLTYRIALSCLRNVTIARARDLLLLFGSEEAFFSASDREVALRVGSPKYFSSDVRKAALEKAVREMSFVEAHNVRCLYFADQDYPRLLRECEDAPLMLYALGRCDLNTCRSISIVGTRHATRYGVDAVGKLVGEIAAVIPSAAVVSGLAYGIDASAHRASLSAGIPTVAVMAHGLNTIYPADHRNLAAEIVDKGGLLVTEYTSQDPIHKANFLARNRIVAGLSECTVVAESAVKGGAMSTARLAAAYSREVMAVPGRLNDPYSAGCIELIATGRARIVRAASDIADACGIAKAEGAPECGQPELFHVNTPEEQSVIDYITSDPDASLADIAAILGRKAGATASLVARMEFEGLIVSLPGGHYRLP